MVAHHDNVLLHSSGEFVRFVFCLLCVNLRVSAVGWRELNAKLTVLLNDPIWEQLGIEYTNQIATTKQDRQQAVRDAQTQSRPQSLAADR